MYTNKNTSDCILTHVLITCNFSIGVTISSLLQKSASYLNKNTFFAFVFLRVFSGLIEVHRGEILHFRVNTVSIWIVYTHGSIPNVLYTRNWFLQTDSQPRLLFGGLAMFAWDAWRRCPNIYDDLEIRSFTMTMPLHRHPWVYNTFWSLGAWISIPT